MGTISNASAIIGLKASGTPTKTNVTGSNTIGLTQSNIPLSDADIAYSFKVVSTTAADVATLDLKTGVVTGTTGAPTITDGDGNDFEGVTLPVASAVLGMQATAPDTNTRLFIGFGGVDTLLGGSVLPGGSLLSVGEGGDGTSTINFNAAGDEVTIIVIARTT